jgi:hypothetical protein
MDMLDKMDNKVEVILKVVQVVIVLTVEMVAVDLGVVLLL